MPARSVFKRYFALKGVSSIGAIYLIHCTIHSLIRAKRMLHWLQKQLVTPETADWIDECAQWVITQFDAHAFWHKTHLVTPDSHYFPEKVSGPEPMAQYVLDRVTDLAGISHWPWQLRDIRHTTPTNPQLLGIDTHVRHLDVTEQALSRQSMTPLQVPFIMDQIAKPQDLVASLAHTCGQHVLWQSQQTPPGGMAYFEQAAEIFAVFAGFGIMLTNSAYTYRGSCARCYNPHANRQASLSESESVYALALFCHLKQQPNSLVFKYLKSHLKNSFKIALKQINGRPQFEMALQKSDGGR